MIECCYSIIIVHIYCQDEYWADRTYFRHVDSLQTLRVKFGNGLATIKPNIVASCKYIYCYRNAAVPVWASLLYRCTWVLPVLLSICLIHAIFTEVELDYVTKSYIYSTLKFMFIQFINSYIFDLFNKTIDFLQLGHVGFW